MSWKLKTREKERVYCRSIQRLTTEKTCEWKNEDLEQNNLRNRQRKRERKRSFVELVNTKTCGTVHLGNWKKWPATEKSRSSRKHWEKALINWKLRTRMLNKYTKRENIRVGLVNCRNRIKKLGIYECEAFWKSNWDLRLGKVSHV